MPSTLVMGNKTEIPSACKGFTVSTETKQEVSSYTAMYSGSHRCHGIWNRLGQSLAWDMGKVAGWCFLSGFSSRSTISFPKY